MKKQTFLILEGIFLLLAVSGFIAFGVLLGLGYNNYWSSISLGLGLLSIVLFIFFLVMKSFNNSKLPEVKQGVICPRCHYLNEEHSQICKQCGEKLSKDE